jgi:hypothetical protein
MCDTDSNQTCHYEWVSDNYFYFESCSYFYEWYDSFNSTHADNDTNCTYYNATADYPGLNYTNMSDCYDESTGNWSCYMEWYDAYSYYYEECSYFYDWYANYTSYDHNDTDYNETCPEYICYESDCMWYLENLPDD